MRRLFVLGIIFVGLLVAFGLAGEDGFQTARRAEATSTTTPWMFPITGGISVGSGASIVTTPNVTPPCTNCYITSIVPDLVYENDSNHSNGTTANFNDNGDNVWLHHMVVFNQCSGYQVFASGNERTTWSLPAGYGYFQTGCLWAVNYHIHNSGSPSSVALKLVVTYQPQSDNLTPVTPVWLDMASLANNSEFYVDPVGYSDSHTGPNQSAHHISDDWTSTIQGQIVAIGGHVHDYGISVSAENLRLGDYICTSTAGYGTGSRYWPAGGPGTPGHSVAGNQVTLNQAYWEANGSPDDRYHIQAMTSCTPTPAQSIICKNDVIRLHTQYNDPASGLPIIDAMGIIVADVVTNLPDTGNTGTIDACKDGDGDGVVNSADNCPNWANPTRALPAWTVPAGDSECDGFPDSVSIPNALASEAFLGTDPSLHCAANNIHDNEPPPDRWPVDFNDDQLVSGGDFLAFAPVFGAIAPDQRYNARFDLNGDARVSGGDFLVFSPFFGKRCA